MTRQADQSEPAPQWHVMAPAAPPALPPDGRGYRLCAPAGALADIAARLEIPAVLRLEAVIDIKPRTDVLIDLDGRLEADIRQECVVTVEPFETTVSDTFSILFTLDAAATPSSEDPLDDDAWPEPLEEGRIDLAELVVQQLALALDPYPRAPGAVLATSPAAKAGDDAEGPLAQLRDLLKRDK